MLSHSNGWRYLLGSRFQLRGIGWEIHLRLPVIEGYRRILRIVQPVCFCEGLDETAVGGLSPLNAQAQASATTLAVLIGDARAVAVDYPISPLGGSGFLVKYQRYD